MKPEIREAPCPICRKEVLHLEAPGEPPELFETGHTKMLVIVDTPLIEGERRVALGPCHRKAPFFGKDSAPTSYFGHAKHRCAPSR